MTRSRLYELLGVNFCFWPILLQKSFCDTEDKFSGPYTLRSNNDLRDYIIGDELTGDFGNDLEATSIGDCGLFDLFEEFCNTIGPNAKSEPAARWSAYRGRPEVTGLPNRRL